MSTDGPQLEGLWKFTYQCSKSARMAHTGAVNSVHTLTATRGLRQFQSKRTVSISDAQRTFTVGTGCSGAIIQKNGAYSVCFYTVPKPTTVWTHNVTGQYLLLFDETALPVHI
ncbi:hypothetical protein PHET_11957 [Paragonimus heterotremus]|uniref:Uncharacterized protein n=1 Tax=Paragonimus heterotremus TaxID=100268 RepID=A0A8J4WL03_9TREM|nr:hypothetical protein PHET_11957 [Paragonimus heterotremus]